MIIVTGASRGLGRALSERLTAKGFEVLGLARNASETPFECLSCDVSSYESVKDVVKQVKARRVEVTGLVNAAGIAQMNLVIAMTSESVRRIIETNLLGTINCCQLVAPLMLRQKSGCIINFSTIAVPLSLKGESVYIASKAGVEGFTRSFAREMSDFGIRVNCLAPGPIDTDLIRGVTAKQIKEIVSRQVIQKQFGADSVSDLTELLFDPRSYSISGQVLHVGGI